MAVKLKEQKSVSRLGNRNDDAEENDKDDSDAGDIGNIRFWNLPIYHDDWRDNLTIELTQEEAFYLDKQIQKSTKGSLLEYVLKNRIDLNEYDDFASLTAELSEKVGEKLAYMMKLACDFNNLVYMARVRYNVMLSEDENTYANDEWSRLLPDIRHNATVDLDAVFGEFQLINPRVSAIYMARNGSSKEEIKAYIEREFHYDLSRTLDNIRTYYHHVESCQETVPEAIIAFLESKDFEDAIRNAVSLGGDTDTLGAITGSIAEAFYGIPAVLIAECKSRIDKGLMTDVLDEFDHVLGRSVDTYSDEVDETQANQMIEAAIDQYYIQQDKNGMLLFMEVMVTRMQQAGEVIVPYITENPFMSEEQISKVKAGDTISLDHDVRLNI